MGSPGEHTFTTEVDPATGSTVTTEFDSDGTVVSTTTTTLDGNRTVEFAPDDEGKVLFVEDGRETDPFGVTSTFHIERVARADGSSSFTRTDDQDDGSTISTEGGKDAEGNSSVSSRTTRADGSVVLTTRTTGPDEHGTEHVTVLDPDGTVVSDNTTDF
jgi:hypothetical protein